MNELRKEGYQNEIIIIDLEIASINAKKIKAMNEGKGTKELRNYNTQKKALIIKRAYYSDKIDSLDGKKILKKIKA